MEKGLIEGVGFSRLTENVRFPSSQVVHCDSTKEMQIYRTDVLFLFSRFVSRVIPHSGGDCVGCTLGARLKC